MEQAVPVIDASIRRHASDLRDMWQGRVLAHAKGKLGAAVLSILAHNFDDAMIVLLRVVFPGFTSITAPFFCSAAKVAKTGAVCADMVNRDGRIIKMAAIFKSTRAMEGDLRRLADEVRMTDAERTEFFACAKRWVVADFRLDPTMDPQDPDATRLVVH